MSIGGMFNHENFRIKKYYYIIRKLELQEHVFMYEEV